MLFDLELLKTVNKGKPNERQEFKDSGSGVTIFSAFKYIANNRLIEKYEDSVIDLATYLREFKSMIAELKQLCES